MNESLLSRVTVVVVTYNSAHIIDETLAPLLGRVAIVVVDNGSSDDTCVRVGRWGGDARLIALPGNVGFGRANNAGLATVSTPYALLLNPDCMISIDAIEALVVAAERDAGAAILAPRLYDAPGRLGLCYRPDFFKPQPQELLDPDGDVCSDFLTGAAMLLRMSAFRDIGFFDPWFFLYLEDDDLCLRARRAGHSLVLVHDAQVEHRVKQSSKPSSRLDFRRAYCATASKLYVLKKHLGDAAYRRARMRMLAGAPFTLLGALLTVSRRRVLRASGRLLAAWRAPRLLRRPHCIDASR